MEFNNFSFCCLIFAFVIACSATDEQADGNYKHTVEQVPALSALVSVEPQNQAVASLTPQIVPGNISTSTAAPSNATTSAKPQPTTQPTTTSEQPTTSPTTVPPTTSPTTLSPITIPTTTNKPIPPSSTPTPSDDVWAVVDKKTSDTCILMKSKVELQVSYIANATSKQINTTKVEVSANPNVNVSGSCGTNNSSQYLVVSWNGFENQTNHINFTFGKSAENKCDYFLSSIEASVYLNVLRDNSTTAEKFSFNFTGKQFEAHDGISFTCTSPAPVKLNGTNNSSAELHLSSLHYEAYHHTKDNKFSSSQDCVAAETPDFVPILVASALILLVVLVLAAYVITRRRSQARGYLSM